MIFPHRHPDRKIRFDALLRAGYIDLDSGAWKFSKNCRRAKCGRCEVSLSAGEGTAYNEFMSDGYRATTKYLCANCPEDNGEKNDES